MPAISSFFAGLTPTLSLVMNLAFAALACFAGYALQRLLIGFGAFLAGCLLGYTVAQYLEATQQTALIVAIVCGALLVWLAFALYKAGIFIVCAYMGYLLVQLVPYFDALPKSAALVAALVVGVLGVCLSRTFFIYATAIYGGFALSQIAVPLIGSAFLSATALNIAVWGVGIVLALSGAKVQRK